MEISSFVFFFFSAKVILPISQVWKQQSGEGNLSWKKLELSSPTRSLVWWSWVSHTALPQHDRTGKEVGTHLGIQFFHFTDRKTDAWRCQMAWPRSHPNLQNQNYNSSIFLQFYWQITCLQWDGWPFSYFNLQKYFTGLQKNMLPLTLRI